MDSLLKPSFFTSSSARPWSDQVLGYIQYSEKYAYPIWADAKEEKNIKERETSEKGGQRRGKLKV
jgi:hypothetical protein